MPYGLEVASRSDIFSIPVVEFNWKEGKLFKFS